MIIYMLILIIAFTMGCAKKEEGKVISAEITPVKGDKEAIVTIISDDGDFESGLIFNKLLKENKLQATVAIYIDNIGIHLRDWQRMEKEGNIQLVSHSYTTPKQIMLQNLQRKNWKSLYGIMELKTIMEKIEDGQDMLHLS